MIKRAIVDIQTKRKDEGEKPCELENKKLATKIQPITYILCYI